MFEFVHVVQGSRVAQIIVQFLEMVFEPAIDFLPRVRDGWRRGLAVGETLHLDLGVEAVVAGAVATGGGGAAACEAARGDGAHAGGVRARRSRDARRRRELDIVVESGGIGEVRARVVGSSDGGQGGMARLAEGDMLAGAIGGIVGGMTVVGGHGMPEGAPSRADAG